MTPPFSRLTPQHLETLAGITGSEWVLADTESLDRYSRDYTEDFSFPPEAVVKPRTPEQIAEILKLAVAEHLPVTPRGAGTGLSGGALPLYGGISLSVERMNSILEIDEENFMVVAESGVITGDLQRAVEAKGLFYPPDPASKDSCLLAGNLAEDSGGPRAVKYGVTRDYVRGVEAVLPTGEIIRCGGKRSKDVAGYNLTQLLIGSEGTLAVITKATLKLLPLPPFRQTLMVPFPTLDAAAKAVVLIMKSGIRPLAVEFIERNALLAAVKHLGQELPGQDAEAQLFLALDGDDEERLLAQTERLGEVCLDAGASDVFVADSQKRQEELWKARRIVGEAVKHIGPYREEDTVVPRNQVPALIRGVREIAARHGVLAYCYGHAGDGNIHVNVIKKGITDERWREVLPVVTREIFELTIGLGGTITGEHGIGYAQRESLPLAFDEATIALMKRLKEAFDPAGILNPGKIFPERKS